MKADLYNSNEDKVKHQSKQIMKHIFMKNQYYENEIAKHSNRQ